MIRPRVEPRSPGPIANTPPTKPMELVGRVLSYIYMDYLMSKPLFNNDDTFYPYFSKGINQKVNLIARLEIELAYHDVTD